MAKRDSDGYRIRKSEDLKSILFILFANLKLVLRSYTSLYGIFMSASLTLYRYNDGSIPAKPAENVVFVYVDSKSTARHDINLNFHAKSLDPDQTAP